MKRHRSLIGALDDAPSQAARKVFMRGRSEVQAGKILELRIEQLIKYPKKSTPTEKGRYTRLLNCLKNGTDRYKNFVGPTPIKYVFQLLQWSEDQLMNIEDMGQDTLSLLKAILESNRVPLGLFEDVNLERSVFKIKDVG
jgi:hypothetical protein